MNKERKSMYISIIALIIAVIGVTIGYVCGFKHITKS